MELPKKLSDACFISTLEEKPIFDCVVPCLREQVRVVSMVFTVRQMHVRRPFNATVLSCVHVCRNAQMEKLPLNLNYKKVSATQTPATNATKKNS